jgi:hypothetical protein
VVRVTDDLTDRVLTELGSSALERLVAFADRVDARVDIGRDTPGSSVDWWVSLIWGRPLVDGGSVSAAGEDLEEAARLALAEVCELGALSELETDVESSPDSAVGEL